MNTPMSLYKMSLLTIIKNPTKKSTYKFIQGGRLTKKKDNKYASNY